MRKIVCLLLTVLFLPLYGVAEEAPAIDLQGDWYVVTLYTHYAWPLAEKVERLADLPESLAEMLDLQAPSFELLPGDAVLIYEVVNDELLLMLEEREGSAWMCYMNLDSVHTVRFEDGNALPADGLAAMPSAVQGALLLQMLESGEEPERIVQYGEDVIHLRYTDEERTNGFVKYGVPSVLFVRCDLVE